MLVALCSLLCLQLPANAAAPAVHAWRSEHYEIAVEGDEGEARELSRVLEAAWPRFAASCDGEPVLAKDKRFKLRVASSHSTWLAALQAEGAAPAHGVDRLDYRPATETVHVLRQQTAWETRALLLRGAWKQFFARVRPKNLDLRDRWWVRALAEQYAMHTWDGVQLVTGARPRIAPIDLPRQALEALDPSKSAGTLFTDKLFDDEPMAWALSELLLSRDSPRDRERFEKLVQGKGGRLDFGQLARSLGPPSDTWRELCAKVAELQMPLEAVAGTWEDMGAELKASPAGEQRAVCLLRSAVREISAVLELEVGGSAGLVAAWVGADDHCTADLVRTETEWRVRVEQRERGKISTLAVFDVASADASVRLRAVRKLDAVHVWIGPDERGPYEVPGARLGLWSASANARFSSLAWR
jgi:hypothetical protein